MSGPKHSTLGASTAERWMNCPGSVALSATLPAPPPSPYAIEGTRAHKVADLCLSAGYEPDHLVGRMIEGDLVSNEMAKAVAVYVEHVRSIAQQYPDKIVGVEQRVKLTGYDDAMFGTCDCSIYAPSAKALYVFDYKHGAGVPVHAEHNPQLKYYALGALIAAPGPVERVVICVVQPRCAQEMDAVQVWETDPETLFEFGLELSLAAQRTREPDAPLVPGKWCRWCPAKGVCPKLYADALDAAGLEAPGAVELPMPSQMTSEEIGRRLDLADRLETWIKALRSHAFAEASAGRMPSGYKLVARRAQRSWMEPEAALREAALRFDLSDDDLFVKTPITPAAFERIVKGKEGKAYTADHTQKASSGVRLAKQSAPGEAVVAGTLADFGDLIDDDTNE